MVVVDVQTAWMNKAEAKKVLAMGKKFNVEIEYEDGGDYYSRLIFSGKDLKTVEKCVRAVYEISEKVSWETMMSDLDGDVTEV